MNAIILFKKEQIQEKFRAQTVLPKQSKPGEAPIPTSNRTQGTSPTLCLMKKR
jgi:hypothetical protein